MTPLIACRMIKLSLDHGVCKDSIFGFVQYAAVICHQSKEVKYIREACRIGKAAMALLNRFGSHVDIGPEICLIYYSFVAPHTEPLQLCTENLRKGFKGKQIMSWFINHQRCQINSNDNICYNASQLESQQEYLQLHSTTHCSLSRQLFLAEKIYRLFSWR